jgi:hypothetical protein
VPPEPAPAASSRRVFLGLPGTIRQPEWLPERRHRAFAESQL